MAVNEVKIEVHGDVSFIKQELTALIPIAKEIGGQISDSLMDAFNYNNGEIIKRISSIEKQVAKINTPKELIQTTPSITGLEKLNLKLNEFDTSLQKTARDTGIALDTGMLQNLQKVHAEAELAKRDAKELETLAKKAYKAGFIDETQLARAVANLKNASSEATNAGRALENYKNTGDTATSRLQAKFNLVTNEIKKQREALQEIGKNTNSLDKIIQKADQLNKSFLQGSITAKEFEKGIETLTSSIQNKFEELQKNILSVGAIIKVILVDRILSFATNLSNSFNSAETAMTGYRKTLDATEQELAKIDKGIINMNKRLPFTIEELSKIAETGGQMGINAKDILIFTEAVAKLGTAISGISPEEAATQLARIIALTKGSISDIDKYASSLVQLGNNYKAFEGEILNFAERIAGAGGIVGMTGSEILGLSTAFVDVGIEAEAGGTAVQKALLTINDAVSQGTDDVSKFAKVSGMSAEEFRKTWESNPAEAFIRFVEGLGIAGDSANRILGDLIGTDVRLQRAFLSVANNSNVLREAIESANGEFESANALQEEFNQRLQTTDSQLQIQKNQWRAWGLGIGEMISKIRLSVGEFALNFIPKSLAAIQMLFANLYMYFQNLGSSLIVLKDGFISSLKIIGQYFYQSVVFIGKNAGILANNIGEAFGTIPGKIKKYLNAGIVELENFLNFASNGINNFAKKFGFEKDIVGEVKLGRLDSSGSEGKYKDFVGFENSGINNIKGDFKKAVEEQDTLVKIREEAFDNYSAQLIKQADLSGKVKDEAIQQEKDKIGEEFKMNDKYLGDLSGLLDDFQDKKNKGAKKATENEAKKQMEIKVNQLDEQRDLEIEAMKNSQLTNEEKAKKILEIEEKYQAKINDVKENGYKNDIEWAKKIIKAEEEKKKKQDKYADTVKDIFSKATEATVKFQEKLKQIGDEYDKLKIKAKDSIRDINEELKNLTTSTDEKLGDRRVKIGERQKQIEDELKKMQVNEGISLNYAKNFGLDTLKQIGEDSELGGYKVSDLIKVLELEKELNSLIKERNIIEANASSEILAQREELAGKSEAERVLMEKQANQIILDERRKIYEAIQNDEIINLDEISNYENLKLAEDLISQRNQSLEKLKIVKTEYQEELNYYKTLDDSKRKIETDFTNFVTSEVEKRKADIESLRLTALRAYEALSVLGMGVANITDMTIPNTSSANPSSSSTSIYNDNRNISIISPDTNQVNSIVYDTQDLNKRGMSGMKVYNT